MKKLRHTPRPRTASTTGVSSSLRVCVCGGGWVGAVFLAITLSVQHGTMNSTCFYYIPLLITRLPDTSGSKGREEEVGGCWVCSCQLSYPTSTLSTKGDILGTKWSMEEHRGRLHEGGWGPGFTLWGAECARGNAGRGVSGWEVVKNAPITFQGWVLGLLFIAV